jgi:hypothetical protein
VSHLSDGGITVDLPGGWDGQIREAGQSSHDTGRHRAARASAAGPMPTPRVLHAASFALPPERGDYGSGAVEVMGGSDILVCLLEHEPEATRTELFRRTGVPRLKPAMFSPQTMQRAMPGMAGAQHFFQEAGRAFCLYVVVGSHRTRGPLVRAADAVVASIHIDG